MATLSLSEKAREVLRVSAQGDSTILAIRGDSMFVMQANGRHFTEEATEQVQSLYQRVVQELEAAELIHKVSKGNYEITPAGHKYLSKAKR